MEEKEAGADERFFSAPPSECVATAVAAIATAFTCAIWLSGSLVGRLSTYYEYIPPPLPTFIFVTLCSSDMYMVCVSQGSHKVQQLQMNRGQHTYLLFWRPMVLLLYF